MLKVLSIFRINVFFGDKDESQSTKGIKIKCGNLSRIFFDKIKLSDSIEKNIIFVKHFVFQHVDLSCIIKSRKKPEFEYEKQCPE